MIGYLREIWALVKPYKVRLMLGILFGILSGLSNPLLMGTVALVADVIFPSADTASQVTSVLEKIPAFAQHWIAGLKSHLPSPTAPPSKLGLVLIVSTVPLAMIIRGLFTYLNTYLMWWVSSRALHDLRTRLFKHLVNLSLGFFNRISTGELIAHVNNAAVIQNTISTSLTVIIREPVTIISLVTMLLLQQPTLTLISLSVMPLCIVPIVIFGRRVRKSSAAYQTHSIEMVEVMHETFTGNRIVKAYNLEGTVVEEFVKASRQFISQYMRMVRATELPGPMIEVVGALGVALVLYIAFATRQTPGKFLQFVGSIYLMYAPIKALTRLQQQLQLSRTISASIFKLLETSSTVPDPPDPKPLQAAGADIHFERIQFDYGEKPVLRDIDLTVKAGQLVALVGSSGSGKTTLSNLLLRFYDPKEGAVRIGKRDIREVSQSDLRNQIAVVTQQTVLFNDTIRRNIALGRPGATDVEIEEAARHAHAYDFIMEKPGGFDFVIGEKGVSLSGGQQQRIAIARAILRNAPILVLDEATGALDTQTERAVQTALEELMVGRTTLCIAHRLSTVHNADLIVVMSEGRIVEMGKHTELLKRGGHYKRLYDLQFPASANDD
jgi:ATP-binding cassette, subfamily B, bacterial MsbA